MATHSEHTEWEMAFETFMDTLPSRISMTPREILKDFVEAQVDAAYRKGQEDEAIAHTKEDVDVYRMGQENMKQRAIEAVPGEYDGSDNPVLNEYTRGYNTCHAEIIAALKALDTDR